MEQGSLIQASQTHDAFLDSLIKVRTLHQILRKMPGLA